MVGYNGFNFNDFKALCGSYSDWKMTIKLFVQHSKVIALYINLMNCYANRGSKIQSELS